MKSPSSSLHRRHSSHLPVKVNVKKRASFGGIDEHQFNGFRSVREKIRNKNVRSIFGTSIRRSVQLP
jgi:hypothetical protein